MVTIKHENGTRRVEAKTVEEAIHASGVSPQTVLAKLNGEFVPDDHGLKKGDILELIRISSIG